MRPDKRHVTVDPTIPDGAKADAHGPEAMLDAAPQLIGDTASRLSYFAGDPVPSSCCVKDTSAVVLLCGTTVRFDTVPGVPVGGGGVGLGGVGLGGVGDGGVGLGGVGPGALPALDPACSPSTDAILT